MSTLGCLTTTIYKLTFSHFHCVVINKLLFNYKSFLFHIVISALSAAKLCLWIKLWFSSLYIMHHVDKASIYGCSTETLHVWPLVYKAKVCLRDAVTFENLFTFSDVCLQFFRMNHRLSSAFWLYQHRVKYVPLQRHSHFFLPFYDM